MIILIDNYDSFTWNLYHFLGDLGAEIIKVEQPGAGDFMRGMGPFAEPPGDDEHDDGPLDYAHDAPFAFARRRPPPGTPPPARAASPPGSG